MSVVAADVSALGRVTPPDLSWPTVAALNRPGVASWSQFGESTLPLYTPATAGVQPAEKEPVPATPISVEFVDAPRTTFGNTIDLSLQARRTARSQEVFLDVLAAATCRQANRWLLEQLTAAAGDPLPSLSDALRTVADVYGGPLLVVTSRIEGAADLAASGVPVLYDPACTGTLAMATVAVQLEVFGPDRLDAGNPALLGVDLATYATLIGPVVSPGAVATGELVTGGGGTGTGGVSWSDV